MSGRSTGPPRTVLPVRWAVALWTAQAYAHGSDCVCYFRWRAATMAQELMHSGLLRHDETLDRGGAEVGALELPDGQMGTSGAALCSSTTMKSSGSTTCSRIAKARATGARHALLRVLRSLGVDVDVRHRTTT